MWVHLLFIYCYDKLLTTVATIPQVGLASFYVSNYLPYFMCSIYITNQTQALCENNDNCNKILSDLPEEVQLLLGC